MDKDKTIKALRELVKDLITTTKEIALVSNTDLCNVIADDNAPADVKKSAQLILRARLSLEATNPKKQEEFKYFYSAGGGEQRYESEEQVTEDCEIFGLDFYEKEKCKKRDLKDCIDVDRIMDMIDEDVCYKYGRESEIDSYVFDGVGDQEKQNLRDLIGEWVNDHIKPEFYEVVETEKVFIKKGEKQ